MYWTIETELSVENVLDRLSKLTVKEKFLDFETYTDKKFKGVINENKFKLRLIRKYNAPFMPFVYGNIKPDKNNEAQTLVYLTTSVTTGQVIFPILLLIFAIYMFNDLSAFGLTSASDILLYFGLFVFIIMIGIGVYQNESNKIINVIEVAIMAEHLKLNQQINEYLFFKS